mgnify:FL=1|tara:strand:- start:978 stop:1676 length:699 start_codon:yes stop_codon:yes gene_type:complete
MVNINTVYQKVLALANKEKRGYITPQEFNLFANQAQLDIFEQYFYDLNQFSRMPGNDTEHADMVDILEEKIGVFEKTSDPVAYNSNDDFYNLASISDLYRLGTVRVDNLTIEKVSKKQIRQYQSGPLTKPSSSRPVYILDRPQNIIQVFGFTPEEIILDYIKKPENPKWAYNVVQGKAIYNSTNSINFELHPSEEVELVIKILELSGITLQDNSMYQVASTEDAENIQQEKL